MAERSMTEINAIAAPIEKQLLTMYDVLAMLSISRTTFYRVRAEVGFPAPITLGDRAVRWHRQAIMDWIDDQVKQSTP